MCMFSAPKTPPAMSIPDAPTAVDAPPPPPQANDPAVQTAQDNSRQRRLAAVAGNNTLVTGGQGLTTPAATGLKTAYGQ